MDKWAQALKRTVTSPLMWGVALLISSMEALTAYPPPGGMALVGAASGVPGEMVPEACGALVYGVLLVAAPRIGRLTRQGWLFAMAPVVGALGMLLCWGDGQQGASAIVALIGVASQQMAFALLMLLGLELLSDASSIDARRVVVGSAVVNAFIMGVAEAAPLPFALLCLGLGSLALWLARQHLTCARCKATSDLARRLVAFPVVLALGLLVIVVSFGFLQELLYRQDASVVSSVIAGTKLAAVAVFVGTLWIVGDANYAILARLVATFTVAAFLVFLAQGSYSFLPSAIMNTGYSLLEMATLLVVSELAATARVRPLRLFASVYLIESIGYVGGCLLAMAPLGTGGFGPRLAAVLLALALLVCAIWVFTEKRVNEFLWGRPVSLGEHGMAGTFVETASAGAPVPAGEGAIPVRDVGVADGEAAAADPSGPLNEAEMRPVAATASLSTDSFADQVTLVAERFRLSPRETEVLRLFAAGRSAAFIAELQFVTTNTVRSHIKHIYGKCDVHSRQELITLIERAADR